MSSSRGARTVAGVAPSSYRVLAAAVAALAGAVGYTNVYLPNYSPAADRARERAGAADDAAYAAARKGSTWSNMASVRDGKA
jgi:hypothetical protein